jgi:hypothetical protein
MVLGSAHETRDLVRAGVLTLSRAVILSSNDDNGENDSDSLFIYQSIAKVRPGVPIVCEIDDGDNVSFLCKEEGERDDDDFTMSLPFAAGAIYANSLQDKMAVQAFYNPNLLRIISELVVGQEEHEYLGQNVNPSHIILYQVPQHLHGKSYIQLLEYLSSCMMLPLGLYRSRPWGQSAADLPYVFTNPSPDILVHHADMVYVLDSKVQTHSEMQVTVKQAHNLHECDVAHGIRLGQSHGNMGLEWQVTVNGCTLCTPLPPEGDVTDDVEREDTRDTEWKDTGLVFGVLENPFPLTAALALVKRPGQRKVAQGQVLLTAACLSASGEMTMWVPLAAANKQVGQKCRLLGRQPLSVQGLSDASEDGDCKAGCQSPPLWAGSRGPGVWIEVFFKHLGDAKLQREVKVAMADGVITEQEQRYLDTSSDANKARLDAVKKAQDDAYIKMGKHSQGALDDATRDAAATKKLQRKVEDAMGDGVLTAEEQRQMDSNKVALVAAKKAQERSSVPRPIHGRRSSVSSPDHGSVNGSCSAGAGADAELGPMSPPESHSRSTVAAVAAGPATASTWITALTLETSTTWASMPSERSEILWHDKRPGAKAGSGRDKAPDGPSLHDTASHELHDTASHEDQESKARSKTRKSSASDSRTSSKQHLASSKQHAANVSSGKPGSGKLGSARHKAISTTTELVAQGLDQESASTAARLEVVNCVCVLSMASLTWLVSE